MAEKIQFKVKYSLTNGNKLNRKNWINVVARSTRPDNCHQGWPEIEKIRKEEGAYYNTWKLKKEKEGYIFREVITNSGINGHHPTYRQAVFTAIKSYIQVFLEEEEVKNA